MAALLLVSSVAAGTTAGLASGGHSVAPTKTLDWAQVHTSVHPKAQYGAMMAYDAADGYVLLFGGVTNSSSLAATNTTWAYHSGSWTRITTTAAPSPRYLGAMAYDAADGYVLLFGGGLRVAGSLVAYNDTWEYLHGVWTQLHPAASPPGRFLAQYAYDGALGSVTVGGGVNPSHGNETDMWKFHAGAWTQITPARSGVPFNGGGSLAYDSLDRLLVYLHDGCYHCGTYEFTHGNWRTLGFSSAQPDGALLSFTYDPAVKLTVFVNGSTTFDAFANGTWTTYTTATAASLGSDPVTAFDASDGYLLMFGGSSTTWKLR